MPASTSLPMSHAALVLARCDTLGLGDTQQLSADAMVRNYIFSDFETQPGFLWWEHVPFLDDDRFRESGGNPRHVFDHS